MISKWPEYSEDRAFPAEEKAIETIKEAVRGIRNIRTEMNVAPSRKASVYVAQAKMKRSAGSLKRVSCSSQVLLMPMRS